MKSWFPLLVLFALLCGLWATPYDPYAQAFFEGRGEGASFAHPFGVDRLGQDFFSRVWRGAANSLASSGLGSLGALLMAAGLLSIERLGGPWLGALARSLVAFGIALPAILLGLLVVTIFDRSVFSLTLAIGLAGVPFAFRQLRVMWMELLAEDYVTASRAIGGSVWHRFRFTLFPNLWPQLLELWKLVMAFAFLELSGLTYLGLGGDPNWAELGTLLRQGQKMLLSDPQFVLLPGGVLCGALALLRWVGRG